MNSETKTVKRSRKPWFAPLTRIHRHNGRKYAYSAKAQRWLLWHESELGAVFCGWLPCVPAHNPSIEPPARPAAPARPWYSPRQ